MASNVLIVYEGAKTERRFILRHFQALQWADSFVPFCYGCNIYSLYDFLVRNSEDGDFENLDLITVLKRASEHIPSRQDPSILDHSFSDIFLVFDLDNHDPNHSLEEKREILRKMADKYNESTDEGLLLIDSPMVESYRDFDEDNLVLNEDILVCESAGYKRLVGDRGCAKNISFYSATTFNIITKLHYEKVSSLLGANSLPEMTPDLFLSGVDACFTNGKIPICNQMALLPYYILGQRKLEEALCVPLANGLSFLPPKGKKDF